MRARAVVLALLMLSAGCLGGSDGPGDEGDAETKSAQPRPSSQMATNASENATYLKNADYNETHIHDYWNGAEQRILLDTTMQTSELRSAFITAFWPLIDGGARTSVGTVWFTLPNNTFVPEGTGEVLVEVDATNALKNGQLQLAYRAANSDEFVEMDPQGAQAAWTIETTPEMADLPHASSTRWYWRLDAAGDGAVLDGEFSVTVIAKKLHDIKAWPEHDDFWDKGHETRLDLFTTEGEFDRTAEQQWMQMGEREDTIHPPEGAIVPPETRVLLVKLWYGLSGSAKNTANADVTLEVKEGSTSGYYRTLWSEVIREEPGFKMFAIEASGANWDSPYAEQSGWAFHVEAPTGLRDPTDDDGTWLYMGGTETGNGNYTLEAQAFRVVPPWLQSAMQEN